MNWRAREEIKLHKNIVVFLLSYIILDKGLFPPGLCLYLLMHNIAVNNFSVMFQL